MLQSVRISEKILVAIIIVPVIFKAYDMLYNCKTLYIITCNILNMILDQLCQRKYCVQHFCGQFFLLKYRILHVNISLQMDFSSHDERNAKKIQKILHVI